ncbi:MAG: rhomboid family intramembrane serine protease [Terriglobia bacterium]
MFWILFPIRISESLKRVPYVSMSLVALNVLIYLGLSFAGGEAGFLAAYTNYGFVPDGNSWYTWLTYMFLHAGFGHLVGNMVFLWLFGAALEAELGPRKFTLLYLAGGLVAALAHAAIGATFMPGSEGRPLVGASGAIGALLGLFILRYHKSEITLFYFVWFITIVRWGTFQITSLAALAVWLGLEIVSGLSQVLSGAAGGVAHWAHIGGFLFGLACAKVIGLGAAATRAHMIDQAKIFADGGDHERADQYYQKMIIKHPASPEMILRAGRNFARADDRDRAVSKYTKALELFLDSGEQDRAFDAYCELIDHYYPDLVLEPRLQFRMGTICEGRTNFELAADAFEKVFYNYPKSGQAELSMIRMAQIFLKIGDEDEASRIFADFLKKYPFSQWRSIAENEVKKVSGQTRVKVH